MHALLVALAYASALASPPGSVPAPAAAQSSPSSIEGPASFSAGAPRGDWWSRVQEQIVEDEYHASRTTEGVQAPNRALNLRTYFRDGSIEVVPRVAARGETARWSWTWQTLSLGRERSDHSVPQIAPRAERAHVSYDRGTLVEWYENRPEGLEQGFRILRAPRGRGRLVLAGRVGGSLTPHADPASRRVDFLDDRGRPALCYAGLRVLDSRQRSVDAELRLDGDVLSIRIDDRERTYPLVVDPVITPAAWTFESDEVGGKLGYCVATAGDVNGDGYSDVIVGAPYVDIAGQLGAGRVLLFHGSASGLSVVADWSKDGGVTGLHLGRRLAAAGDVNADGYDDVVIGLPASNKADIYFGSTVGLGAVPGYTRQGGFYPASNPFLFPDSLDAEMGESVAGVGDVNGDGYDDVAIGAPGFYTCCNGFPLGHEVGRVYLLCGDPTSFPGSGSRSWGGTGPNERFGNHVAAAGDVNADGYQDVVADKPSRVLVLYGPSGASYWYPAGVTGSTTTLGDVNGDGYADVGVGTPEPEVSDPRDTGISRIYYGSSGGIAAVESHTFNGSTIAPAGDVNGDGFADILYGEHSWVCSPEDPNCYPGPYGIYPGVVRVIHGGSSALGSSSYVGTGPPDDPDQIPLATAGDVNGDGYSDILRGQSAYSNGEAEEGRVELYYGKGDSLATNPSWNTVTSQAGAYTGYSVASVGDINGDGYGDIAIGNPLFDNGEADEGRVAVYLGQANGMSTTAAINVYSDQVGANLGISVSGAGDVNGDGYSDMIFGAPTYANGESGEGRAYLYYGAASLPIPPPWTAEVNQVDAWFGFSVGSAGDVNGDGYADLLIGAPLYDGGQVDEGRAYLYYGSPAGPGTKALWTAESNQADARFGWSVAGAGDVNGDGLSDVVVGAPRYSKGQLQEGRLFSYYGAGAGLAPSPAWTAELNQVGAYLGYSVASAGDVNGDGYGDVIAGAPYAFTVQTGEGKAILYHGSSTGLQTTASWTKELDQDNAHFGWSVSSAGDVDNDGYSDVIVGAEAYDDGQADEGAAFLFHGSAVGLDTNPARTIEMDQADAHLGHSVARAGDENGDGFGDVVVGAPFYDTPSVDAGRAWLFYGNRGDGLERKIQQARVDDATPIDNLGRSETNQFRLWALGRTPAGRGRVRLEWEVKPIGTPFDGTAEAGTWFDTGVPAGSPLGSDVPISEAVTGLSVGTAYHWRLRMASDSPFFPHAPWFTPAGNPLAEADLRVVNPALGVPRGTPTVSGLFLERPVPNPARSEATFAFTLPARLPVTLSIYDVLGRRTRVLLRGAREAGRHSATWDGRDQHGDLALPGIYVVRLEAGATSLGERVVWLPR